MTTYTNIMGLAVPATGETSWGDIINNYLTTYLDSCLGGALTVSADTTIVRTTATSLGSTSWQYPVLIASGHSGPITVTVGSSAITIGRPYFVHNNTLTPANSLTIKAYGQTGVSFIAGEKGVVIYSGGDYVKVASSATSVGGSNTQVQYNNSGTLAGNANLTYNGTTLTGTFAGALNGTVGATTPSTGVFTTVNKVAITAPASTATLTIANNKTFTVNNSVSLTGTDGTTFTLPTTSATAARTDAAQTFTGRQTFSSYALVNSLAVGTVAGYQNTVVGQNAGGLDGGGGGPASYGANVYVGYRAGGLATSGVNQVAIGNDALKSQSSGQYNVAIGSDAMSATPNGAATNECTAIGTGAGQYLGYNNGDNNNNTLVGYQAGYTLVREKNTIIGSYWGEPRTDGGPDINAVSGGGYALIAAGQVPKVWWDNNGYMTCLGLYNNTTGSSANLYVNSSGLVYRSTSSQRYKTDIQNASYGLNDVLALRPVTYKHINDGDKIHGGLIAEEVDLAGLTQFVNYDKDGQPDSLAYGNMVSLLVKAVQELTARVAELEAKNA